MKTTSKLNIEPFVGWSNGGEKTIFSRRYCFQSVIKLFVNATYTFSWFKWHQCRTQMSNNDEYKMNNNDEIKNVVI